MVLYRLKTLPVDLDAMTTSQATDLTDLLAGTADAGFAADDEGRILVWTRAERGGRTVRMIRDASSGAGRRVGPPQGRRARHGRAVAGAGGQAGDEDDPHRHGDGGGSGRGWARP